VPTNISITGFDDDRVAESSIPSISTARQPFFEIGQTSADVLYAKIEGATSLKDVYYVSPVFVARQSCGCLEESVFGVKAEDEECSKYDCTIYSFVLSKYMSLFKGCASGQRIHSWATALVEQIFQPNFEQKKFLHLFNDILIYFGRESREYSKWYNALTILTDGVEQYKDSLPDPHAALLALNTAAMLIHDIRIKDEKVRDLASADAQQLLRRVTSSITLTFCIGSLNEELARSLPEIGLNSALIGLYQKPVKSSEFDGDRSIHTLIGFDKSRTFNIVQNGPTNKMTFSDYTSGDKFPFARERRAFFFMPLFFDEEELGVMLLPYESHLDSDAYESLRVSISSAMRGAELISKVETLSITDELTGLLNRRGFFQFVYSRLQHLYRRTEIIPLVLFLDMDGLKYINDNFGHKDGDIAISAFAKILKDTLREEDIVGRLGGDEFAVFSSVKSKDNGESLVDRLRKKLDEYNAQQNHPYSVLSSMGCVALENASKECFEAAMLNADNILYEEKAKKRAKGLARQ
jgi:diguanylate cyclase (GGDEF)-like protein